MPEKVLCLFLELGDEKARYLYLLLVGKYWIREAGRTQPWLVQHQILSGEATRAAWAKCHRAAGREQFHHTGKYSKASRRVKPSVVSGECRGFPPRLDRASGVRGNV